jgi:anti-sigma B factor antagonist
MNMEIFERPCDTPGVTLLDLDGGLDHTTTADFVHRMDTLLEKGTPRVVLDLEHLTYASSWGLAALVRVHHHFAVRGGRIAFARLHSAVAAILRTSRLDELFDLYPTIGDAVRGITRAPDGQAPGPPAGT